MSRTQGACFPLLISDFLSRSPSLYGSFVAYNQGAGLRLRRSFLFRFLQPDYQRSALIPPSAFRLPPSDFRFPPSLCRSYGAEGGEKASFHVSPTHPAPLCPLKGIAARLLLPYPASRGEVLNHIDYQYFAAHHPPNPLPRGTFLRVLKPQIFKSQSEAACF